MPGTHRYFQVIDSVYDKITVPLGVSNVSIEKKRPLQRVASKEVGSNSITVAPHFIIWGGAEETLEPLLNSFIDAIMEVFIDIWYQTPNDQGVSVVAAGYRTSIEEALNDPNDPGIGSNFIIQCMADGQDKPYLDSDGDTHYEVLRTRWKIHYRRHRGNPAGT